MGKPNNSLKHDEKGVQSKDALESILATVVTGHDEYEYNRINVLLKQPNNLRKLGSRVLIIGLSVCIMYQSRENGHS